MAYQTTNPATGETVATFEEISDVELAKVIDVAQSCYEADWLQIEAAKAAGARVVTGGGRVNRPGFFVEPTILTDITESNPVYTQEVFGPVASFYVVDSEDEAIALANATPFGLGGSVFTADVERGHGVARRIESGMVFVNHSSFTAPELPFGGIKNSGYGRELSELGFGEFVNRKLIDISPAGSPPPTG